MTLNIIKRLAGALPANIKATLKIFTTGVAGFTLFRMALLLAEFDQTEGIPFSTMLAAFIMGLRFDVATTCYLLSPIFIVSLFGEYFRIRSKAFFVSFYLLSFFLFSAAFVISAADVPYFSYFNSRISVAVLNWADNPLVNLNMIIGSPSYYPFILMFALMAFFLYRLQKRITAGFRLDLSAPKTGIAATAKSIALQIVFVLLIFIGIRGRFEEKAPLHPGIAFFSVYPFANHLGLNPVFTFMKSVFEKDKNDAFDKNYMDDAKAEEITRRFIAGSADGYESPFARYITANDTKKYNVVIVLMESMSYERMGRSGMFRPSLTPNLDTLAEKSLFYDNIYSGGTHTFNGIWSSCYSAPCFPVPGNLLVNPKFMITFSGIGPVFLDQGYSTFFFCPHDPAFDNISGSLSQNGFESVGALNDVISSLTTSPWGVDDHVFFEKVASALDEAIVPGKPFLSLALTVSNHGPWRLPDPLPPGCEITSSNTQERSVQYSDWAIGHFMEICSKKEWFANTVFVFMADHGATIKPKFDLDLGYNRIPMIFYCPALIPEGRTSSAPGMQADMFPTLAGIIGLEYVNNTLGIDLQREKRPFAVFCADDNFGVVGDNYYYFKLGSGRECLYELSSGEPNDLISKYSDRADSMRDYANANFQVLKKSIESGSILFKPRNKRAK